MHDWIIEGLPPQVLVHHKRMLGIYEDDNLIVERGLNANGPKSHSQKPQLKEKLMNRT